MLGKAGAPSRAQRNMNNVNDQLLDLYFGKMFFSVWGLRSNFVFQQIRPQTFGVISIDELVHSPARNMRQGLERALDWLGLRLA